MIPSAVYLKDGHIRDGANEVKEEENGANGVVDARSRNAAQLRGLGGWTLHGHLWLGFLKRTLES